MRVWRHNVAVVALLALAFHAQHVDAQTILKDERTFFEFAVPSGWALSETDKARDKYLVYKVLSPAKSQAVYVYVFESDNGIDLEKLADTDTKLGWDLGKRIHNEAFDASSKRRTYDRGPKGLYATALFRAESSFGYLILALSTSSDLRFADPVFASVAVKIPRTKRMWNGIRSVGGSLFGWFGGLVALLAFWVFVYILGKAGSRVRQGVEMKCALEKIRKEAHAKGMVLNEKFHAAARKATLAIALPIACFVTVFASAFVVLPIGWAFASLLLLIPSGLGYIGIVLGPSTDLEDYVPD